VRFRALGRSGVHLSAIGFGAWAIGGGNWIEGWGRQDDEDSIAAIHRACELGVNWIDTAGAYGYGHSEEVIARALRGMHEPPMVFTKCTSIWDEAEARRTREAVGVRSFETAGHVPGGGHITSCLQHDSIRREVEGSLRRLQVDVLDMCQIHLPLPDADIEEGWAALSELRDEGKVRLIGVSNFDVEQMRRAQAIAPIDCLQPMYSMLNRDAEADLFPYCAHEGIGVCVYSPMASGVLTGRMTADRLASLPPDDWRRDSPNFAGERLAEGLRVVQAIRPVAERRGCSLGELAIAWTLCHAAVTGATVGFRAAQQVDLLVEAAELDLGPDDLEEIAAALPERAVFEVIMEGTPTA
jgi:aryl-alcohol dehydrogenase-like predicted oxidoreductase